MPSPYDTYEPQDSIFVLTEADYESSTDYYFIGPSSLTQKAFYAIVKSFLPEALERTIISKEGQYISTSPFFESLCQIIAENGFKRFEPKQAILHQWITNTPGNSEYNEILEKIKTYNEEYWRKEREKKKHEEFLKNVCKTCEGRGFIKIDDTSYGDCPANCRKVIT